MAQQEQEITGTDLDRALKEIREDQRIAMAEIAKKKRRRRIPVEKAELGLKVAIWIGDYLQQNPLSPLRLAR